MTAASFIPTIWSASLLIGQHKALKYGQPGVVNTDYEGEISQFGDVVNVNTLGAVTVFTYTKNTDMDDPQTLSGTLGTLTIDQAKAFNFLIDDIDKAQQKPKLMNAATQQAAYALAESQDEYLAGLSTGATTAFGSSADPVELNTPASAYEQLVDVGVALDDLSIPSEGRSAIVPPWFVGLIEKDDRFVGAGTNDGTLRNGFAGNAGGIDVIKSVNVPTTGTTTKVWRMQVATSAAESFANQVVETEAYRPEKRFADALKGLTVYGAELLQPDYMAVVYCNKTGDAAS